MAASERGGQHDRVQLVHRRDEAKRLGQAQLEEGEGLVKRGIRTKKELDDAENEKTVWVDFTCEVLRQIATTDGLVVDFKQNNFIHVTSYLSQPLTKEVEDFRKITQRSVTKLRAIYRRLDIIQDSSVVAYSETKTPMRVKGDDLCYRILKYLSDRERQPGGALAELSEIAETLGVSQHDVSDQIDILDSMGAIRAGRAMSGDASPMLTGKGKLFIEEWGTRARGLSGAGLLGTPQAPDMEQRAFEWDVFVCHASEDKEAFVQELVRELARQGIRVWYDEFTLAIGDSLRQTIDKGLSRSRYGITVLSKRFFEKQWPQRELDGLVVRERDGKKVILPIWLDVDSEDVAKYSPMLADRVAAKARDGIETVVRQLVDVIRP